MCTDTLQNSEWKLFVAFKKCTHRKAPLNAQDRQAEATVTHWRCYLAHPSPQPSELSEILRLPELFNQQGRVAAFLSPPSLLRACISTHLPSQIAKELLNAFMTPPCFCQAMIINSCVQQHLQLHLGCAYVYTGTSTLPFYPQCIPPTPRLFPAKQGGFQSSAPEGLLSPSLARVQLSLASFPWPNAPLLILLSKKH